ncbi:MAG: hypothetical protein HYV09_40895 [Deltaproteobacteria bacterium]|nr:hypothetical protein [Deltaproteobacteria bacterium]
MTIPPNPHHSVGTTRRTIERAFRALVEAGIGQWADGEPADDRLGDGVFRFANEAVEIVVYEHGIRRRSAEGLNSWRWTEIDEVRLPNLRELVRVRGADAPVSIHLTVAGEPHVVTVPYMIFSALGPAMHQLVSATRLPGPMITVLSSATGSVRLQTGANGRCEVTLHSGDHAFALGADDQKLIVERLGHALGDNLAGSVAGELAGTAVRWVLSLSERHATIYAGDAEGVRRLFIQDADGKVIAVLDLSPDKRREWLAILRCAG